LVAVVIAVLLFANHLAQRGPLATITFSRGNGIAAGDRVQYLDIEVGRVEHVALSTTGGGITVQIRLMKSAAHLARKGSTFYVVRPQISLTHLSGLSTLLGAKYIDVLPGDGAPTLTFTGLDAPPLETTIEGGLPIILESTTAGSIALGAPVYYREVEVGEIIQSSLSPDATKVELLALIDPTYAPLVRLNTKFWNASGISFSLFGGLKMESLDSLLEGGVVLATPNSPGPRVADFARFSLAAKQEDEWLKWAPEIEINVPSMKVSADWIEHLGDGEDPATDAPSPDDPKTDPADPEIDGPMPYMPP
jgi:paraquat-inducible protein B